MIPFEVHFLMVLRYAKVHFHSYTNLPSQHCLVHFLKSQEPLIPTSQVISSECVGHMSEWGTIGLSEHARSKSSTVSSALQKTSSLAYSVLSPLIQLNLYSAKKAIEVTVGEYSAKDATWSYGNGCHYARENLVSMHSSDSWNQFFARMVRRGFSGGVVLCVVQQEMVECFE
jgi:hypothetical protein